MPRRMAGRMVRTMGRTAVVAGTATAVSGRVARRQQGKMTQEQQAMSAAQQPPPAPAAAPAAPPPPPPAAAPPSMDERVEALERLAALKEQGFLTDEEFAAQKAKLLAG